MVTELLTDGPEHGTDTRRFRLSNAKEPIEAPVLTEVSEQLLNGFFGRLFTRLRPIAEEVEKSTICLRKVSPGLRPSCMDDRILSDDQSR